MMLELPDSLKKTAFEGHWMGHVKAKPLKPAPVTDQSLTEPRQQMLIWGRTTLKSPRHPWALPSLSCNPLIIF